MNNCIRYIFLLLMTLPGLQTFSQQGDTVSRFVISPLGNWRAEGGVEMTYTIGQIAIETETGISGQTILRQGFHQPTDSLNVSVEQPKGIELTYKIYPNPTKEKLFVELETEKPISLSIQIFDMAGKRTQIPEESFLLHGNKRMIFDLSSLPAAFYNLKLMDQKNREMKSFKIRKIH